MFSANRQIAYRHHVVTAKLVLQVHAPLVSNRLHIVAGKNVDIRGSVQRRRRGQDVGVEREVRAESISLNLDPVLRECRARENGRSTAVIRPIAAPKNGSAAVGKL